MPTTRKQSRRFHLGQILSVTTGRLLAPDGIDGVYRILEYLAGEPVWTHQLGRVCDECKPWIYLQHPQLQQVTCEEVTTENWRERMDAYVQQFGKELDLAPLPGGQHTHIDPVEEARAMVGDERVIVVKELD